MNSKHEKMTRKVGFVSLGCAKNLVNTEQMMFLLTEAGYHVTGETDGADAVIVNTCGFIESAKTEAIDTILDMGRAKAEGRVGRLIVAGCLPERYKNEIMKEMPEIDAVIGVGSFEEVAVALESSFEGSGGNSFFGDIDAPVSETGRIITTSPAWAYIKIAEGCDNRCSFCIIPELRGRYRSRPMENIVREARGLAEQGTRELIVVAQDVTRYGLDIYGKRSLPGLLNRLCDIEALEWIRLHYLYPADVDDELIKTIVREEKILNYLDIPIQHINDGILRKMNRRDTKKGIYELIKRSRERIKGSVLRTTVITGLPGEGEAEFEELCEFLAEAKIERTGVFPYSPEEGTAAYMMDRPDAETALRRAETISEIQSHILDKYNESRIGSITRVLIEGRGEGNGEPDWHGERHGEQDGERFSGGLYYGRSFAESPDVDGYISVSGKGIKQNEFAQVLITGVENGELIAEQIGEKEASNMPER